MPLTSSPRPKARPSNNVTSSPRPKARPTSSSRGSGGGFFSGNTKGGNLGGNGGGGSDRSNNNVGGNPGQTSSPKPQPRPTQAPDNSLLLNRLGAQRKSGGASFRGAVLSNLYRLPADGTRAVRSLQSFNGPSGRRTVLGQ